MIFVGIGGSATIDGGMGMLEAFGIRFVDISDNILNGNGENVGKIAGIDAKNLIVNKN